MGPARPKSCRSAVTGFRSTVRQPACGFRLRPKTCRSAVTGYRRSPDDIRPFSLDGRGQTIAFNISVGGNTLALTLVEASKLSNDTLLVGVIETIASESPILQRLPFIEIIGNSLTYNRENVAPTAAFYDVGDDWTEDTPTFTQASASLKILGGDADVDNFLKSTRSNVQDLEAAVVQLKARAVQNLFDDTFINGDETADPKSFDGLNQLCVSGQTLSMGVMALR